MKVKHFAQEHNTLTSPGLKLIDPESSALTKPPTPISIGTCQFFKDNKLHKPVGQVQFVVFEKFASAYHTKLQENTYYYLLTIYRKNITESQHRQNFENVHMLFVICTLVTTLH